LTDSVYTPPETGIAHRCPHWRSVFSSVFKEPKLVGTRTGPGRTQTST